MKPLVIRNLSISLAATGKKIVDGISFEIAEGERLGIIGESGSGKSVTALAALGLLPDSMRASGTIELSGVDMIGGIERERIKARGTAAAMVFQEPLSALDPLMKVGRQVAGPIELHRGIGKEAARSEARRLLERVRLPDVDRIAASYPHELSGGQRQRIAIAMALACKSRLLIADEPTTALDVTVQAEVLDLLDELVDEEGVSLLFISHDLPVIARMAKKLLVMRDGRIVESNDANEILSAPRDPYTIALMTAARFVTTVPYVKKGAGE